MNIRDLLISALRYTIKNEPLDEEAIRVYLDDKKLTTLLKVAKNHDVAHLVAYALEKNGFACDSSETWYLFLKEKEQAKLRYEMMKADINEICFCFDKNGIDYIPLKGAVLRDFYPKPWMRTSCDVDILVRDNDLNRAVESLVKECSYTTDGKKTYHDISLFSPFGMHLELHHNIKETIDKYDELLTQVWTFSVKSQENKHKHMQTSEFLMFHLIAHMAYHFVGGGCGLRSVLDIWLLRQKLNLNDEVLYGLLEKAGLTRFFNTVIELSEYWFDDRATVNDVVLETEKYVLLGGAYGTSKQNVASKRVKQGGKFKYFISRIFMPYESLVILYPIIAKHKILTPFCQILRWFSVLFKTRRIKSEIRNVSTVSDEQSTKLEVLLKSLEI